MLCEYFLKTSQPDIVLEYIDELNPEIYSFKVAFLVKFALRYNNNFNTSKKLIKEIRDPSHKFSALESFYSRSKISSESVKMQYSVNEISNLMDELESGEARFNALIFLARHYLMNNEPKKSRFYIDLAKKELKKIPSNISEDFETRLKSTIDAWEFSN